MTYLGHLHVRISSLTRDGYSLQEVNMNKNLLPVLALLLASFFPAQVVAGDFDGSKALICVPLETFECEPGQECDIGTAQSIDIPQFLKIDFKKKTILGTKQDGTERKAKIQNKTHLIGVGEKEVAIPKRKAYQDFFGDYSNAYSAAQQRAGQRTFTKVRLETNLYDVKTEKPLWSGQSKTWNPLSQKNTINEVIQVVIADLKKNELLP